MASKTEARALLDGSVLGKKDEEGDKQNSDAGA